MSSILFVAKPCRRPGIGAALISAMEAIARQSQKSMLYLSVEPLDNPQALQLYLRLGYVALQAQPYHNVWRFTDSGGNLHEGEEWLIDMRKSL